MKYLVILKDNWDRLTLKTRIKIIARISIKQRARASFGSKIARIKNIGSWNSRGIQMQIQIRYD